jgi:coenzyme F420-reducing hydrogenase alpha subunit
MISFRNKSDKEDMIYKAKQMEKFAKEFVECLESGEEEYHERMYRDGGYDRDDMEYRGGTRMRDGRYGYNR